MIPAADAWTIADPIPCSVCGREACEDHLPPELQGGPLSNSAHVQNLQGDDNDGSLSNREFAETDSGNAEFFAARNGHNLRYDFRRGRWLVWTGQRWQPDIDGAVDRLAIAAMRQRLLDASNKSDREARARAAKWALQSEARSRLEATTDLAKSKPPINDRGDNWDTPEDLLGVLNGTIDLRTGVLREARRDDRLTLTTGISYDPGAESELWDEALRTILLEESTIQFFQTAVGYSATGDMRRDCWFLNCGSGRNGKGTLLQPIRRSLGDYALELPGSVFDLRSERSPYELAALPGKRFITSSEAGDTLRLHHDRIKQLTGGDAMSAANKYERAFEFEPVCKLWLSCNKRPRVTDDTAAFWARVVLIPFTVSFLGREDRGLRPALVQEPRHQAAILAWIVRGAMRYYREGLTVPQEIRAATLEFERDNDPLADFLDEACECEVEAEIGATELFDHYKHWAEKHGMTERERLSSTMFGKKVTDRFTKTRKSFGMVYKGLARRPL